ncbi:MAG: ATP-grasp domain-containing protein [bacterium]
MRSQRIITVLVTGAGAPGIAGTIYALYNNPDGARVKIIACDMRDNVVGKYLADEFFVVPPAENPAFAETLMQIAIEKKVDVILPQVTLELLPLAEAVQEFQRRGINIAVSSSTTIARANDKWLLLKAAEACKVPFPRTMLTRSKKELIEAVEILGYPQLKVAVKPRISHGMRGFRIISAKTWDVTRFLKEKPESVEISLKDLVGILENGKWPELLIQEFLPGPEYTVDAFCGKTMAVAIPRLREEIRSGITFQTRVELRPDLQEYVLRLAEELDLRYAFGFQFKLDSNGVPKVIECNPRVQGTMVTAVFAGYNVIWFAVKEALGEENTVHKCTKHLNVKFLRYWGGVAVQDDQKLASI